MPKIILLNGPPGSGKDTACNILHRYFKSEGRVSFRYRFASPLKRAVHELFGLMSVSEEAYNDIKEEKNVRFFEMSPREAYIWMSEEVVKPKFGKSFFSQVAINKIDSMCEENKNLETIIISDCGFQIELNAMAEHYGEDNISLIQLYREGRDFSKDSRGYVTHTVKKTYPVQNNSTVEDFEKSLISLGRIL